MITLHLEAESLDELKALACKALDISRRDIFAGRVDADPPQVKPQEEPKRPVGRPRKVQPDPLPEIDPVDEALEEGFLSNEVDAPEPNGADPDPIALEKLKQETVAKLPDMFAAGKVNLMRAVLTKYGKGAKSFPEIEAKDFPEIAAALARGDGS